MGYGYLKSIRELAGAFDTIMLGDKAWLFLLLMIWVAVMTIASTAYFVHKLRFAMVLPRCTSCRSALWASWPSSPCSTSSRPTRT